MQTERYDHRALREARRAQGITQREAAEAIGCRQSAICMLERGQAGVLAAEKIASLARRLGVPPMAGTEQEAERILSGRRFCPVYDCPSNTPFVAGGMLRCLPAHPFGSGAPSRYCSFCGEVLESACPNPACGVAINPGACCGACGGAYVPAPDLPGDPREWADAQRRRLREIRS